MKNRSILGFLPAFLLIIVAVYLAFKEITIAHSILYFGLCGAFCYQQYLFSKDIPDFRKLFEADLKRIEDTQTKLVSKMDNEIAIIKDEFGKVALNVIKTQTNVDKRKPPTNLIF